MRKVFNNIVSKKDLKDSLSNAFKELDSILVDHAGPFATDSVIGSKWRQVNDVDEFTKDGIKILRHLIVNEEPSARFAVRMARFIGIAVDQRCHDGTTTSMLLFCRLALIALTHMRDEDSKSLPRRNRKSWIQKLLFSPRPQKNATKDGLDEGKNRQRLVWELKEVLENCLVELDKINITEDDLFERSQQFGLEVTPVDVRSAMAYHMAMISSKGDHDLSSKIATVISRVPKKIYGMFRDTPLAVETVEKYHLKRQTSDLSISGNLGDLRFYNHRNDSQYLAEDAVVFATGNEIVTSSNETAFLKAFISTNPKYRAELSDFGMDQGWEAFHEGKRPLVILSPMVQDSELIAIINTFNMVNPQCKIAYLTTQINGRLRTSLNKTLHYMAGAALFDDVMTADASKSLIGLEQRDVKVHMIGHTIELSNLYVKDGDVYHPFYRDPELFPSYTTFVKETEELIEFAMSNITNPALEPDEVTHLTSLYRSLTCQEIWDIEIGGSAHDQYANRTVYEDAIGAALSALSDGVVLGGYSHIGLALLNGSGEMANTTKAKVGEALLSIVSDSLRLRDRSEFRNLIETTLLDKWHYVAANREVYFTRPKCVFHRTLDKDTLRLMLAMDPKITILLQAWSGYHEQFKRFRDILPRLSNTTSLIDMRINEGDDVR